MPRPFKDITGQKFGRLTAVQFIERKNRRTIWEFRCDCGLPVYKRLDQVESGAIQSCGCYQSDVTSARMKGGNATSFKKGQTAYNKGKPAVEWLGEEQVQANIQRLRDNPPPPDHIYKVCEANKKPVVRMDLYGKVLEIHDSIISAANAVGATQSQVGSVCHHRINNKGYESKTCKKHTFLFLDEYLERFGNEHLLHLRTGDGKATALYRSKLYKGSRERLCAILPKR